MRCWHLLATFGYSLKILVETSEMEILIRSRATMPGKKLVNTNIGIPRDIKKPILAWAFSLSFVLSFAFQSALKLA